MNFYLFIIYAFHFLVQKTFQQKQIIQSDRVFIQSIQEVWETTQIGINSYRDFTVDLSTAGFKNTPQIVYSLTVYNTDNDSYQGFKLTSNSITQTTLSYRLESLGCSLYQLGFNVLAIDDPNIEVQSLQLNYGTVSKITGSKPIIQVSAFIYGFRGSSSSNLVVKYNLARLDSTTYQISFQNSNVQTVFMNFLIVYEGAGDMFEQLYGYQTVFDTQGQNIGGSNTVAWTSSSLIDSSKIFYGLKDFSIKSNGYFGIKIQSGQTPEAQNQLVNLNYFTWNNYYVNMINGIWTGLYLVSCEAGYTLFVNSTYYDCVSQCSSVDHHYNNNPSNTQTLYTSTIQYCQQCDTNCFGCENGSSNLCTDCYNNQYLDPNTKTCSTVQPPQTICSLVTVSGQSFYNCQNCHSTCKQCSLAMSSNSCISCDINTSNKYFYNNQCLTSQPNNTQCDSNFVCLIKCDINSPNRYFYNNQCLSTKPSSTFCDSNYICQRCDLTCKECLSPGNPNSCISCDSQYKYFYNNSCSASIPLGTYCDSNFYCHQCHFSCKTCSNSASECTSCDINTYKYFYNKSCSTTQPNNTSCDSNFVCYTQCDINSSNKYSYNNQCLNSKPSSTICDSNFICQRCDLTCKECLSPGNSNSCTSCDSQYKYFYNNSCSASIPPGTYCDSNFYCHQCNSNCKSCSNSASECTSCDINTPNKYLYNKFCSTTQPNNTWCDSNFVCFTQCDINSSNKYSYNNQCLNSQPSSTICDSNFICQSCDLTCKECLSPRNSNSCTSCDANSQYKYFYNNSCSASIPPGTYCDSNFYCHQCNSSCKSCSNSASECTSCDINTPNKYFYNKQCSTTQPNNTQCDSNFVCTSCNSSECTQCDINSSYKYFYNNQCLNSQPSSTFCDSNFICQRCDLTCKECISPGNVTSCTSCDINSSYKYFYNNQCLDQIPPGVYCDSNFVCEQCDSSCKTCLKSTTNCTSCIDVKYLNNGTCLCLPGYFMDSQGDCISCANNCLKCYNQDTCQQCVINYVLSDDKTSCKCNIPNCQQCDKNDGSLCNICNNGFLSQYNNKICDCGASDCLSCDHSNGNICNKCQLNYVLNSNSSCECAAQNCAKCNKQDGSICDTCKNGYISKDNNKTCQCAIQNCLQCDPENGNTCLKCQPNYQFNSQTNICACSVPYCQTCSAADGSICDTCQSGYIFLQSSKICIVSQSNDFHVQQAVIQTIGYNITIQFQNQPIMTNENPNTLFNVQIADYDNPFQVNYLGTEQSKVFLQVNMENNCKDRNLIVIMNDPLFINVNNLQEPEKKVKLSDYIVLTQNQIQQAENTKKAASSTSILLYILTLLMTILGKSYVLFSTIDLTTFIYFMLFFNVRYPENVLSFCSIFQNFQFAFIPNTIQLYFMDLNYTQPNTPQKFVENGYDAYFFNGAGQSFTIIIGIVSIYLALKILSFIPIPSIRVYIQSKIKSGWEYCGFFDLAGCVYVYVLVSALSQFYCFKFDESLAFLNYTLFALSLTFVLIYPVMLTIFIVKCKNLRDPEIQQQFGSIYSGYVLPESETKEEKTLIEKNENKNNVLNLENQQKDETSDKIQEDSNRKILNRQQFLQQKWSKFTNVFLYLRKMIYIMVLLFLYGNVYLQVIIICLMNAFLSFYYLYLKPQEDKSVNIKNGISEIILIVMQASICFLVQDDEEQDEQHRFNIGWLIVALASFILAIHIFSVIFDLIKGTFNLIKDFIVTLLKSRAELKKLKIEKEKQANQSDFQILHITSQVPLEKLGKVKGLNRIFTTHIISQLDPSQKFSHLQKFETLNNQSFTRSNLPEKQEQNLANQSNKYPFSNHNLLSHNRDNSVQIL